MESESKYSAFLKHMFRTCCITTRLTKCLDIGNGIFFFRVAFSSSCLLAHSTPFSRSTKSRSIILVQLWLWYRTIQHNSNFLLDFWSHEDLVPHLSGGFDWSHHKLYVYSEDFSFIGSLPWLRAKIVEEFTRAVSCMCANITKVHFIDFVFIVWNLMRWSTISVPPFVKLCSLYDPNL